MGANRTTNGTANQTTGSLPIGPFLVIATIVIIVEIVLVGWLFKEWKWFPIGNNVINSSVLAAVLAGSAVGIERIIEFGWTAIGLTKGTAWPLVKVGGKIGGLADDLDKQMQPFYTQANAALTVAADMPEAAKAKVASAKTALDDLQAQLNDLIKKGEINNQQLQILAATASARIEQINDVSKDLDGAAAVAKQAISVLSSVADGFQDRPGRRLISLYAGAFLGLLVASALGLDIFQVLPEGTSTLATATPTATPASSTVAQAVSSSTLGVIFTGLVIGLGSSPTHEVIKLVQEVKKNFKNGNATIQNNK